jgi:hypothetical protein
MSAAEAGEAARDVVRRWFKFNVVAVPHRYRDLAKACLCKTPDMQAVQAKDAFQLGASAPSKQPV